MEEEIKSSIWDILNLRCLLDMEIERMSRHLGMSFRKEGCAGEKNVEVISKSMIFVKGHDWLSAT